MTVFDAIMNRRSVRSFEDKFIPSEIIDKFVDALIWAPSAGNLQSRKFFFVKDETTRKKLASAALGQSFIAHAPLVVVGCADSSISMRYGKRGVSLYAIQDVSASLTNLMLLATEEGLGTVWVGAFDEAAVTDVLGLPNNLRPVAIMPVGYPAKIPSPPRRVSREEAVSEV